MVSPTEPQPQITPVEAAPTDKERSLQVLSVRRLMWIRFKRNKLAVVGLIVLGILYFISNFAGFFAPYQVDTVHQRFPAAPPTPIRFIDADGNFSLRPFVYEVETSVNPETFQREYQPVTDTKYYLKFFQRGEEYTLYYVFGLVQITTDLHLFLVDEPAKIFLLGTDSFGRDLLSRVIYGSTVSLTVGLIGVFISLIIGTFMGVFAGYFGGWIDNLVQRLIEVILSFPRIPLWIALAAVIPPNVDSVRVFLGITIVLSVVSWGGLARGVRAKVLSLREQDYVRAARYNNGRTLHIMYKHLFPNTLSHVLVSATLAIPAMILGETTLSFLGLGIRAPMTSWGLLLSDAQKTRVLLEQPWILTPTLFVMVTVIAFNFVGDGLRDAADPFS